MKNILITTQHRGVFFAQVDDTNDLTRKCLTDLKNARMAIRFGTRGHGVVHLASDGPTDESLIGSKADIPVLHDVTAVFDVTDKAAAKWLNA